MTGLALVILSARLLPLRDADDLALRHEIAGAIVDAVDPDDERADVLRALLVVIAAEESSFRADVADCRVRGDNGRARGPWQIHPRSPAEYRAACTLDGGAFLALERVRESLHVCRHMPEDKRLGIYNAGRCDRGTKISARRWRLATGAM